MTQEQLLSGGEIQKEIQTLERSIGKIMAVDLFNCRHSCGYLPGESFLDSLEVDIKKQAVDRINSQINALVEKFKAL